MTDKQETELRKLYARVLAAGDGDKTLPIDVANHLAQQESIAVILDALDGHPDLDATLRL